MCSTPYCYGDCDECIAEQKRRKEDDEYFTPCPYNVKCKWETVNVKLDRCTTCGKTFDY